MGSFLSIPGPILVAIWSRVKGLFWASPSPPPGTPAPTGEHFKRMLGTPSSSDEKEVVNQCVETVYRKFKTSGALKLSLRAVETSYDDLAPEIQKLYDDALVEIGKIDQGPKREWDDSWCSPGGETACYVWIRKRSEDDSSDQDLWEYWVGFVQDTEKAQEMLATKMRQEFGVVIVVQRYNSQPVPAKKNALLQHLENSGKNLELCKQQAEEELAKLSPAVEAIATRRVLGTRKGLLKSMDNLQNEVGTQFQHLLQTAKEQVFGIEEDQSSPWKWDVFNVSGDGKAACYICITHMEQNSWEYYICYVFDVPRADLVVLGKMLDAGWMREL